MRVDSADVSEITNVTTECSDAANCVHHAGPNFPSMAHSIDRYSNRVVHINIHAGTRTIEFPIDKLQGVYEGPVLGRGNRML